MIKKTKKNIAAILTALMFTTSINMPVYAETDDASQSNPNMGSQVEQQTDDISTDGDSSSTIDNENQNANSSTEEKDSTSSQEKAEETKNLEPTSQAEEIAPAETQKVEPVIEEEKETADEEVILPEDEKYISKQLIVGNPDEKPQKNSIISELDGIYLLKYDTVEQTKEAYEYYLNHSDFADINSQLETAEGDNEENDVPVQEQEDGLTALSEAIKESSVEIADDDYTVALIDTGVNSGSSQVIESVSMLGGSADDDNGHGTAMLDYITKYNSDVKVISIKALDSNGKGNLSNVYAGIKYAIEKKVNIINLSMSAYAVTDNAGLKSIIDEAREAGIIVVGAAGNKGMNVKYFTPGNIQSALIVGACDSNGNLNSTSNYGAYVDYNVTAASTSEACAKMTGLLAENKCDLYNYESTINFVIKYSLPEYFHNTYNAENEKEEDILMTMDQLEKESSEFEATAETLTVGTEKYVGGNTGTSNGITMEIKYFATLLEINEITGKAKVHIREEHYTSYSWGMHSADNYLYDTCNGVETYLGSSNYDHIGVHWKSGHQDDTGTFELSGYGLHRIDVRDTYVEGVIVAADTTFYFNIPQAYNQIIDVRYENADGTKTNYSEVSNVWKLAGETAPGWSRDADSIYKAANFNSYEVSSSHTEYITVYRKSYTYDFNLNKPSDSEYTPETSQKPITKLAESLSGDVSDASMSEYNFLGWYDAPTGGNKYTNQSMTSNKTWYAHWERITYQQKINVRYQQADGSWSDYKNVKDVWVKKGGAGPTWSRNADTIYKAANTSAYTVDKTYTQNVDVYRNEYTYSFDLNKPSGCSQTPKTSQGKITKLAENQSGNVADASMTGYTFLGWYDAPTGGNKYTSQSMTSNKTWYAHWQIITYKITYDLNDSNNSYKATNNSANPTTYTIESPTIVIQDPSRPNYNFVNWTGDNITIPTHSTGDRHYKANWELQTRTLTVTNTVNDMLEKYGDQIFSYSIKGEDLDGIYHEYHIVLAHPFKSLEEEDSVKVLAGTYTITQKKNPFYVITSANPQSANLTETDRTVNFTNKLSSFIPNVPGKPITNNMG